MLVRSDEHLTAVIGLDNVIVVATGDAVLVADQSQADKVKQLVERLKAERHPEATQHRRMYRPWGYYQSIDQGARYQVKRIVVRPGGRLSLQKHYHRAEHWIVVRGAAEVTLNGDVTLVHENESIYLPIGSDHRLANPGKIDLELIEVQTGSYLGEDDIVRIEDVYNRKSESGGARKGRRRQTCAFVRLVLFPRREAGDLVNVGAIDADIVQLTIGVGGQFLDDAPVGPTRAQEAHRENSIMAVSFADRPPVHAPPNCPGRFAAPSPRPT